MDYSKTVNLPQTDFPMKADLAKREPAMLKAWEDEKLYAQQREKRKDAPAFILHDGPPYANGHLHMGHALNKVLKDIIVRYKNMAGFDAPYVPGWDCHGLPIELQLMKDLKLDQRALMDARRQQATGAASPSGNDPVSEFRKQAQAYAEKFVGIQRDEFKRMGILGDWDNPYLTMDADFKAAILESFKELQQKGYIYRGRKPVYWCATDETALAEAEVEYENDPGPAIHVAFPLHSPPDFNEDVGGHGSEDKAVDWTEGPANFVIWTTTPWTLPANVAIAYNPEEFYVLFQDSASKKKYVIAEKRLESFQKLTGFVGNVLDRIPGHTFRETLAKHPWIENHFVPLLPAGFVTMDTGTGLVHIAPGHGVEDYQLGLVHDLDVVSPVDERGRFTDEVPEWKGQFVFKANDVIIEFLKQRGSLLHHETITHSYPHCWRCHKPVIFRATEQWFLNVDHNDLRKRALEEIEKIDKTKGWIPAFGKNRIRGMVESRPDWCLSRQRIWGTEIPQAANRQLGTEEGSAVPAHASPDIFDVWFESGVSWNAVLNKKYKQGTSESWKRLQYPADLYLEGSDQHRGWFQTSLIPSVALRNQAPFKTVLTHGFVVDGEGRKMSKSLGNVIAPDQVISQYGADILRLWVASSDYANDVRLSQEILKGLADTYRKVRNTFRFLLGNVSGFDPKKDAVPFDQMMDSDRWILDQLSKLVPVCTKAYDAYQFHTVSVQATDFCASTLSGIYLDITKDRLYCDAPHSLSRRSAQTALFYVTDVLTRLWAPILPFTANEAWQALGHSTNVSLEDYPKETPKSFENTEVRKQWEHLLAVRDVVLQALEKARQEGVVKNALQTKIGFYTAGPRERAELIKNADALKNLCLVSEFVIAESDTTTEPPASKTVITSKGTSYGVTVSPASGQKCGRCWLVKTDVGADARWADVCKRCADVLGSLASV